MSTDERQQTFAFTRANFTSNLPQLPPFKNPGLVGSTSGNTLTELIGQFLPISAPKGQTERGVGLSFHARVQHVPIDDAWHQPCLGESETDTNPDELSIPGPEAVTLRQRSVIAKTYVLMNPVVNFEKDRVSFEGFGD